MVNQRASLYQQAKVLARTLNIAQPTYRTATFQSLRNFITNNNRPTLPFLGGIRERPQRDSEPVNLRYVRNRAFGQIEIEIERNETIIDNTLPELANVNNLRRVLNRYLADNTTYKVVNYRTLTDVEWVKLLVGERVILPVIENKIGYVMTELVKIYTIMVLQQIIIIMLSIDLFHW